MDYTYKTTDNGNTVYKLPARTLNGDMVKVSDSQVEKIVTESGNVITMYTIAEDK